jgi:hypothetical protein
MGVLKMWTKDKEKMKLPQRYNYAEAYLTFRCNLNCDYCINKFGEFTRRDELTAEEWADALNRIDFGNVALTLGGGEPTLYKGFYELVDRLNMPIDLLTNLQFDVEEFIKRVNPDKFSESEIPFHHPIRASYHAEQMDRDQTIKKMRRLRNAGFNAGLFGIRHPYLINENMAMAFLTSKAGIPFYEKDFLGEVDGRMYGFFKYPEGLSKKLNPVLCRTRELLIASDGLAYRCHRDLYKGENPIGDIRTMEKIEDIFRPCKSFGECNPCDVKLKTNKYLEEVDCQVEIK